MQQIIIQKDGTSVPLTFKKLTLDDVDCIMALQDEILALIEDPQIYFASTREEVIMHIQNEQTVLGYITPQGELVSLIIYIRAGYDTSNYGYDIDLQGEALLKVGQVDTVLVKPEYRGHKLQYTMCMFIEDIARETGVTTLCATASPFNPFSVNNFLSLGYEVQKDKLKYGGLRRYVFVKSL